MVHNAIILEIGSRYGRLTILGELPVKDGHRIYECLCDCGNICTPRGSAIKSGNTVACGCVGKTTGRTNSIITHGETRNKIQTPEYRAYSKMIQRCYNPSNKRYKNYGGRGIKICNRWLKSFSNFLDDMGRRPINCTSIDRVNVNNNYGPSNCRWATGLMQASNKTTTKRIIVNGVETYQSSLAKELNVSDHAIEYHLKKGKSADQIVTYFKSKIYAS